MKRPLTPGEWASLWRLRRAGFSLDLLAHNATGLTIDVFPQAARRLTSAGDPLTWIELPLSLRSNVLLSLVEVFLLLDPPLEFRAAPEDAIPAAVRALVSGRQRRGFRFTRGAGEESVLHLPARIHLRGSFLLSGHHDLPLLRPGESLAAELWLRSREGIYYGAGLEWRFGAELSPEAIEQRGYLQPVV